MTTYLAARLRGLWLHLVDDPTLHPYLKEEESNGHFEFVQQKTQVSHILQDTNPTTTLQLVLHPITIVLHLQLNPSTNLHILQ